MSIINLPLVPPLPTDGQVGDAVPLDATINYIVNQVNANAQPMSAGPLQLEWQPLGQTPTYVSGTSFTVPGNLTTTLQFGRVLQTLNTSGLVYSIVTSSVFTSVTTVTVVPYLPSGTALDTGLSQVNFGFLNALNPSPPAKSVLQVLWAHNVDVLATGVSQTLNTANGFIVSGTLFGSNGSNFGEYNTATGIFTATRAGWYNCSYTGSVTTTGTTFTLAANSMGFSGSVFSGGSAIALPFAGRFYVPVGASGLAISPTISGPVYFAAGATISFNIVTSFTGTAPVFSLAELGIIGPL